MSWSEETIQRKSQEFGAIAAEYNPLDFNGLEEKYSGLQADKELLEASLKGLNQRISVIESIFTERLVEQDLKSMKFNSGHKIGLRFKRDILVDDPSSFIGWVKQTGLENELTINYHTRQKICKGYLEETGSLPPGVKEGEPIAVISYTRSK